MALVLAAVWVAQQQGPRNLRLPLVVRKLLRRHSPRLRVLLQPGLRLAALPVGPRLVSEAVAQHKELQLRLHLLARTYLAHLQLHFHLLLLLHLCLVLPPLRLQLLRRLRRLRLAQQQPRPNPQQLQPPRRLHAQEPPCLAPRPCSDRACLVVVQAG